MSQFPKQNITSKYNIFFSRQTTLCGVFVLGIMPTGALFISHFKVGKS